MILSKPLIKTSLLSRIILGTRVSFSVGFISVFISIFIGLILGMVSGYYGGKIDIGICEINKAILEFIKVLEES